jgi:hypothetical protein
MVYVVERYLPGLCRTDLLPGLARLTPAIQELHGEGSAVRYLGSTIVLGDEACFCEFEGSSAATVAEVNRRAGLPFDRIVPAVLVQSNQRSSQMSVSTSIPRTARLGRSHPLVLAVAAAAIIAVTVWAIMSFAVGSTRQPADSSVRGQVSVLRSLPPNEQQYVRAIASMNYEQLAAAFSFDPRAGVPGSLTAKERRYVQAVAALNPQQLAAAFGNGR